MLFIQVFTVCVCVFEKLREKKEVLREENESISESADVCFCFIDKICVEGYDYVYKQSFNMCVVREM